MRKKEIVEKLKALDEFIENVSSLQRQLFEKLGYEWHWEYKQCCHKSIPVLKKRKKNNGNN